MLGLPPLAQAALGLLPIAALRLMGKAHRWKYRQGRRSRNTRGKPPRS